MARDNPCASDVGGDHAVCRRAANEPVGSAGGQNGTASTPGGAGWHALATIWACQAGKDVYVEKPASHNVFEGRKMVEAARRYGRMVQVGMQSRSIEHKRRAIEMLRDGVIGKVEVAQDSERNRHAHVAGRAGEFIEGLSITSLRPLHQVRVHPAS